MCIRSFASAGTSPEVRDEFRCFLGIMPCLVANLRQRWSETVYMCDASLTGRGVVARRAEESLVAVAGRHNERWRWGRGAEPGSIREQWAKARESVEVSVGLDVDGGSPGRGGAAGDPRVDAGRLPCPQLCELGPGRDPARARGAECRVGSQACLPQLWESGTSPPGDERLTLRGVLPLEGAVVELRHASGGEDCRRAFVGFWAPGPGALDPVQDQPCRRPFSGGRIS